MLKLDLKAVRKGKPVGLPYQGSKKKIAKQIVQIIKQNFGADKPIYDVFGGGGAITAECLIQGLNVHYNDGCPISAAMLQRVLSQDPGQAGKSQVLYLTRQLAGFSVSSSPETGDKITRAEPFAAQVNVGNVLLLDDGTWDTKALIAEMRLFPNGKHDDQVDALSRAFNELMAGRDYLARFNAMTD